MTNEAIDREARERIQALELKHEAHDRYCALRHETTNKMLIELKESVKAIPLAFTKEQKILSEANKQEVGGLRKTMYQYIISTLIVALATVGGATVYFYEKTDDRITGTQANERFKREREFLIEQFSRMLRERDRNRENSNVK